MDPVEPILSPRPASNYTRPTDPSKFIRTFAKDVARVTNTPAPVSPAPPVPLKPQQKIDEQLTSTEEGVTVTEYDSSPVDRKGDPVSPKEYEQEQVTVSAADSEGIFGNSTPVSTTPLMPQGSISIRPPMPQAPDAPPVVVPDPVPAEVPKAAEEDERAAIMARLRSKLSGYQIGNAEPPSPVEQAPASAAPSFVPTPLVTPSAAPLLEATAEGSSPLHTYSSDFADRIDEQKSSTFAVLAAESDAREPRRASLPNGRKNLVPLLAGMAMLIIGGGAVIGAYIFSHRNAPVPSTASVPSLITYDEAVSVRGSGQPLMQSIVQAGQGGSVSGNIIVTYLTGTSATSSAAAQSGGAIIRSLSLGAPDILLRNIDDSSTVGIVRAGSEARPFMILKVSSYERTFAGMLAWEPTIGQDLAAFYPPYTQATLPIGTTTATSSVVRRATGFADAVVSNHDVRVLRDQAGKSILLYGYRGKDLLIIARDKAAFSALISRLSSSGE